jgi:Mce-associated membrane protein
MRLPVLLTIVAGLLFAVGGWFLADRSPAQQASPNLALVDSAATAEVTASVTNSLNRIFSYSFDQTATTEQAATTALRGKALESYQGLFAQVRAIAPTQKLVLTTRVVNVAVQQLTRDQATLLVFLDQSSTRAETNSTSAAAAQLSVTAKREGAMWVITDLMPK